MDKTEIWGLSKFHLQLSEKLKGETQIIGLSSFTIIIPKI